MDVNNFLREVAPDAPPVRARAAGSAYFTSVEVAKQFKCLLLDNFPYPGYGTSCDFVRLDRGGAQAQGRPRARVRADWYVGSAD